MQIAGPQLATIGYSVATAAFALFVILLIGRGVRSGRGKLFVVAIVASLLWAASGVWLALDVGPAPWWSHQVMDGLRALAWTAFVAALLTTYRRSNYAATAPVLGWGTRLELGVSALLAVLAPAALVYMTAVNGYGGLPLALGAGAWVLYCVIGLMLCEQLFRGTAASARWSLKPLVLALGAIYGYDLFVFSDALLLRRLDAEFWGIRGLTHALTIPLLMLATVRNRDWAIDIAVSRNIVFGSTALLLSGLYLLAVSAAGYYVRLFGGDWGRAIQTAFLFGALVVLAILFLSGSVRARVRVFINKNFFSYRYDYRAEWLKFTAMLAAQEDELGLKERCIKALADLVESPGGQLWLAGDDRAFHLAARWNMARFEHVEPASSEFVEFLTSSGWVINLSQSGDKSTDLSGLAVPRWLRAIPEAWLTVPLLGGNTLVGFVVLARPRVAFDVNWEVLDLLKTGARQAAAVLGQVRATEALVEAQQLNAFSRMSAFVVHDLKNLVAQLSLMLKNAERHSDNPEFQRDMLETVEHVVGRMNQLLMQLRSGATPIANPVAVDVSKAITRIRDLQAKQGRRLEVELADGLRTIGHEDRLERIIGHLVQNAFDAISGDGLVKVRTRTEGSSVVVEVQDTGAGMTQEFIRERLFRPFHSTKATGMGIGTFEIRQYVTELGGRVTVDSTPGRGTTFALHLPAAEDSAAASVATEFERA